MDKKDSKKKEFKVNYNIKISEDIFQRLDNDVIDFKLKNRNQLINKIVLNYVKFKNLDDIYERIMDDIALYIKDENHIKNLRNDIKKNIYETIVIKEKNTGIQLNFRLNKETSLECEELGEHPNYFNTEFFRGVFEWYTLKPKYKREGIVFFEEFKEIKDAIKDTLELKLDIKTKDNKIIRIAPSYPIDWFSSKDENYNYLVSSGDDKKIYATRLSNIQNVLKIQKKFKIDPGVAIKAKERVDKKHYTWGDIKLIKIKLTEEGYYKYQIISHLKPECNEKSLVKNEEGNYILSFYESEDSMLYYFTQFGKEVEILEPKSLKDKFEKFYREALELYG